MELGGGFGERDEGEEAEERDDFVDGMSPEVGFGRHGDRWSKEEEFLWELVLEFVNKCGSETQRLITE